MRILVARPDRMGDVILSTPVLEAIKRALPGAKVTFLVKKMLTTLFEKHPFVDDVIAYDPAETHHGITGLLKLKDEIKSRQFDVALNLFAELPVVTAQKLAGIPKILGPRSKWFSYVFFTNSLRQKRSKVLKHEAQYNLELLSLLDIEIDSVTNTDYRPKVMVDIKAKEEMEFYIKSLGLSLKEPLILIHPGMGGSALNWPQEHYVELIRMFVEEKSNFILTGSLGEKKMLERLIEQVNAGSTPKKINTFIGDLSESGLSKLAALISLSKLMIAPSTGPLHLASALGVKTVSFFPPIKVQSSKRWGPYVGNKGSTQNKVWVPEVKCPQTFQCAGVSCPFYFCMSRISVRDVFKNINEG